MDQSEEERRANKAQTRELYERDTTLRDSAVDSLRAKIEKVESPTNTLDEARFAEEPSDAGMRVRLASLRVAHCVRARSRRVPPV